MHMAILYQTAKFNLLQWQFGTQLPNLIFPVIQCIAALWCVSVTNFNPLLAESDPCSVSWWQDSLPPPAFWKLCSRRTTGQSLSFSLSLSPLPPPSLSLPPSLYLSLCMTATSFPYSTKNRVCTCTCSSMYLWKLPFPHVEAIIVTI